MAGTGGTPVPTSVTHIPGTVNPSAHAAAWGTAKIHQVIQARQKATQQPKAKAVPKSQPSGKSKGSGGGGKSKGGTTKTQTTTNTRTTTTHGGGKPGGEKPWYEMGKGGIHHLIEKSVQGAAKEEESAPNQRIGELHEINATQQANLAKNTASTTTAMQGIAGTNAASAKTQENEDAEHAQQAIARVGEGTQGTSPSVTGAEAQFLSSTGQNEVGANASRQASESDFLTKLQATAQLRGQEQQSTAQGKIAGQEGQERAKLNSIKAGEPGRISDAELKILPEQARLQMAAKELGVKRETAKETHRATERRTSITAANDAERNRISAQGNDIKAKNLHRQEEETASQIAYRNAGANEKAAKQHQIELTLPKKLSEIEAKTKHLNEGKKVSEKVSTQEQIAIGEISKAAQVVKLLKEGGNKEAEIHQALITGGTTKTLGFNFKGVKNGLWATAAIEIVTKGFLSTNTKRQLEAAQQVPRWFKLSNYALYGQR